MIQFFFEINPPKEHFQVNEQLTTIHTIRNNKATHVSVKSIHDFLPIESNSSFVIEDISIGKLVGNTIQFDKLVITPSNDYEVVVSLRAYEQGSYTFKPNLHLVGCTKPVSASVKTITVLQRTRSLPMMKPEHFERLGLVPKDQLPDGEIVKVIYSPIDKFKLMLGIGKVEREKGPADMRGIYSPSFPLDVEFLAFFAAFLGIKPGWNLRFCGLRTYKSQRKAVEMERDSYWPLLVRELDWNEFKNLINSGFEGVSGQKRTMFELERALRQKGGTMKFVKFSSRIHSKDIDFLCHHSKILVQKKIKSSVYFVDFDTIMKEALGKELQYTQRCQEIIKLINVLGEGTFYPGYRPAYTTSSSGKPLYPLYFIPHKDLDYIMNLVRLYFSMRKLEGKRNVEILFYETNNPSLRGIIFPHKVALSLFQEEWPGFTDRVAFRSGQYVDDAERELEGFSCKSVDPKEQAQRILKRLEVELEDIDRKRKNLPYTWEFVRNASKLTQSDIYKRNQVLTGEGIWSDLISNELLLYARDVLEIPLY